MHRSKIDRSEERDERTLVKGKKPYVFKQNRNFIPTRKTSYMNY